MSTEATALLSSRPAPPCDAKNASSSSGHQETVVTSGPIQSSLPNYHSVTDPFINLEAKSTEGPGLQVVDERRRKEKRVLVGALLFCFVFMIVEFGAGVIAHSLALLTDATHLLTDVGSYALSLFALVVAGKSACGTFNYGWHRAEVLGTLLSVFTIYVLVGWIMVEAFSRTYHIYTCSNIPSRIKELERQSLLSDLEKSQSAMIASELDDLRHERCDPIDSRVMIVVGVLGLLVNVICACILYFGGSHGHSHFNGHGHSHGHDNHAHASSHSDHQHHHGHGDHGHSHNGQDEHHHTDEHVHTEVVVTSENEEKDNDNGSNPPPYEVTCRRASRHLSHLRLEPDTFTYEPNVGGWKNTWDHDDDVDGAGSGWLWSRFYANPSASPLGEGTGMAVNAALLHAMGDCMQSLGVIFAGCVIFFSNRFLYNTHASPNSVFNLADPICSIFFAVITLRMTTGLLGDLLGILMETTPARINYEVVENTLQEIPNVVSIHDLHVWSLNSDYVALSAHLVTDDAENVLRKAQEVCRDRFNIDHTTFQIDTIKSGKTLCTGNCSP